MTIKEAINLGSKIINIIDAKSLLKYALNVDNQYLIINYEKELTNDNINKYFKQIDLIKNGKPLQYITNKQEFMGLNFYVNEDVLIPQPDTEILVEETLKIVEKIKNEQSRKIRILDLCTGSGAIGISIKKMAQNSDIEMWASDISPKALEVAKMNTKNILNDENNIKFIQSDLFDNIHSLKKFDIIISNPPYIKTEMIKTLDKDVQNEPILALDGGIDGCDFYRKIRSNIVNYVDGYVLLEIGYDLKEEVINIFEGATCKKDYAGNDRVIIWNHFLQR